MWDLNGSPFKRKDQESQGCYLQKTSLDGDDRKRVGVGGSVSNSSSSAIVIEEDSEEDNNNNNKSIMVKKKNSKIFGFSVTQEKEEEEEQESLESGNFPVTRNFFPMDQEGENMVVASSGGNGTSSCSSSFPRAHWVGVKFCQSETLGSGKSMEVSSSAQPMKKSRRGPRSRSSQYRGVTFYRRTGRWESHIW